MQFKHLIRFILVAISALALVACHSHKRTDQSVSDANAAYSSDDEAESSGTGEDSSFDDEEGSGARSKGQALNKRIYYFDYDSNAVHEDDKPAINANADYLLAHAQAKVLLEGHTDPRGSREYNIGLGERRAKAVAAILTAKGVDRAQIRVVSYGAEKLASEGHNEAAYQQDRRVVLAYLQK